MHRNAATHRFHMETQPAASGDGGRSSTEDIVTDQGEGCGTPQISPPCVELNARYTAACMEINTRITQRQHTLLIYATLVFGIGAALTAKTEQFDPTAIVFAIPFASLICSMLYLMHDLMIRNLVEFCRKCERYNNETLSLPGYYSDPCQVDAVRIRRLHDLTAAVLIVGANTVATIAAIKYHSDLMHFNSATAWACGIAVLMSIGFVLSPVIIRK